jgi:hypothetical protein
MGKALATRESKRRAIRDSPRRPAARASRTAELPGICLRKRLLVDLAHPPYPDAFRDRRTFSMHVAASKQGSAAEAFLAAVVTESVW